jgi:hypothetical protein
VQLPRLEGIQDFVAIVVQLVPGDAKFGQGVGGVSKSQVGVQVLEEVGEFSILIKLPAGIQGDPDKFGLLNFHIFKAIFELVELVGVVGSQGGAEYALDESTHKMFVLYLDLEINWGLMLAFVQRDLGVIRQISKKNVQAFLEIDGIFF